MDPFELEIKQTFLEESQQLLEEAEGAFLAMDAGNHSQSQVDQIFRLAHNFKGSAKAVGFDQVSHFAHKTEDVLSLIRNGQLNPDKLVCTILLKALDALKSYIHGLKTDLDFKQDTSDLEKELSVLCLQVDSKGLMTSPVSSSANDSTLPEDDISKQLEALFAAPIHPVAPPAHSVSTPINEKNDKSPKPVLAAEEALRVSTRKLDELLNLVGEMVVNQTVMNNHRMEQTTDSAHALQTLSYMGKIVSELQSAAMSLRMMPVKPLFQRLRRSLRDVAEMQSKDIDLITDGDHVELDKTILEKITDPLNHLMRNAADHGIESADVRVSAGKPVKATVTLTAEQQEDHILITISDDGKGLDRNVLIRKALEKGLIKDDNLSDQEAYALIFKAGFSTKEQVTDISGRGVGLDVVQRAVEELKGDITIKTELGKGTSFIVSLPLSLSIIAGMVVSIDQKKYVIPVSQMVETIEYTKFKIESSSGKGRMINLRGEVLPILSLNQILHGVKRSGAPVTERQPGIVTSRRGKKISFEVDEILGQQQVVLKKLGPELQELPGIIAGAVLGNGEPGLILNLHELVDERRFSNAG